MRLELTGRHVDITPVLRRLLNVKLAKLERVLQDAAVSAQAVLTREKYRYRAEITLHARGEKFLHGVGNSPNCQTAVTEAVDKITQQAQKVKGRWTEGKRQRTKTSVAASPPAPPPPPARGPSRVRTRMPRILRAERQAIKAMSVADAARAFDGRDGGLLVFRDVETDTINVLFRRNGELTLVETER